MSEFISIRDLEREAENEIESLIGELRRQGQIDNAPVVHNVIGGRVLG